MSDLHSVKSTKSQNLLNIVKGLKKKKVEKALPSIREETVSR